MKRNFINIVLILIAALYLFNGCSGSTTVVNDNKNIVTTEKAEKNPKKALEYFINGGIYMINQNILHTNNLTNKFSFEKDLLEKLFSHNNFYALISEAYFIDIGVPEDYRKAEKEFPDLFSNEY